ncbi:MAG: PrgI family protein [Candidatus Pacearchaeota archaeon]
MEIKINKEVRDYSEKVLFGLTGRQFLLACSAIILSTVLFFVIPLQTDIKLLICLFASSPLVILGFAKVQGHTVEEYLKRRRDRVKTPNLKLGNENIYHQAYRRYQFERRYRESRRDHLLKPKKRKASASSYTKKEK